MKLANNVERQKDDRNTANHVVMNVPNREDQ